MKEVLYNLILFVTTIIFSHIYIDLYSALTPGSDSNTSLIFYICTFIIGEIAICTNLILKKLDSMKVNMKVKEPQD